jgi:tetratricopeptide (TPR) repeat protein
MAEKQRPDAEYLTLKKAYEKNRIMQGEDHPDTLASLDRLADYYDRTGDYDAAIELEEEMLTKRNTMDEKDEDAIADSYSRLAGYYCHRRDFALAQRLARHALKMREEKHGKQDPLTWNAAGRLANIYADSGKYEEAAELGAEIKKEREAYYGPESHQAAVSSENLSSYYAGTGDYEKAILLGKEAMHRYSAAEDDSSCILRTADLLAGYYTKLRRYDDAIRMEQEVLAQIRENQGENHPDTITILNNLAYAYGRSHDHNRAVAYGLQSFEKCRVFYGDKHFETLKAARNLAGYYRNAGYYEKAAELAEKNAALSAQLCGPTASETISDELFLAECHAKNNDSRRAIRVGEAAVTHLRDSLGYTDPLTLKAVSALSDYYYMDGNLEEAVSLKRYVYEKRKEIYGEDSRETLRTAARLISLLIRSHETEEALDLGNHYFDLIRSTFGKISPVTRTFLADMRQGLEEYDRMEEDLQNE